MNSRGRSRIFCREREKKIRSGIYFHTCWKRTFSPHICDMESEPNTQSSSQLDIFRAGNESCFKDSVSGKVSSSSSSPAELSKQWGWFKMDSEILLLFSFSSSFRARHAVKECQFTGRRRRRRKRGCLLLLLLLLLTLCSEVKGDTFVPR